MTPRIFGGKGGLRLEQSLGAFPVGEGDISPLYVIFSAANPGAQAVTVQRVYVRAGRGTEIEITSELGGDAGGPPRRIPSGESATLWMRAKDLSGSLRDAGHAGTPKLRLVAVDDSGSEHTARFRLRVDEYLRLEDE